MKTHKPLIDRFFDKVEIDAATGCWEWTAYHDANGYARFHNPPNSPLAYRFAYASLVGPIPEGLTLDHLCRNRGCVNPAHLEPVTMRENVLRGVGPTAVNAAKTHCVNGHPLAGENLLTRIRDGNETRECCECGREARRQWKQRNPEARRASWRRWNERRRAREAA